MRFLTYNILNGGVGREAYIRAVVETVQPDVAVLQEVYDAGFLKSLGTALGMQAFFGDGNKRRRVGLLSRLPLRAVTSHHPFPPIWRNVLEAEVEYQPGKTLSVIGVHPIASLAWPCEWWRWLEARQILTYAARHVGAPCLIAGDCNAIAPGDHVHTAGMPRWLRLMILLQGNRVYRQSIRAYLSAGFTDCFRRLNPNDDGFTLPPPLPNSRLDYLLANARLAPHLKSCRVVREPAAVLQASDHYPVVAEFELE